MAICSTAGLLAAIVSKDRGFRSCPPCAPGHPDSRPGGRYGSLSDCRSICATYPAAFLSPCHLRRSSMTSQPRVVREMAIPRRRRRYRRGPLRNDSATPASKNLSASSRLTWATSVPSYRRTGVASELARLGGGAVSDSARAGGAAFIGVVLQETSMPPLQAWQDAAVSGESAQWRRRFAAVPRAT